MLKSGFTKRPTVELLDQKLTKGKEKEKKKKIHAFRVTHGHAFGHGPEQAALIRIVLSMELYLMPPASPSQLKSWVDDVVILEDKKSQQLSIQ